MLLVFCSFHITHNIQKPISSLLQDGANYSAKDTFFEGIKEYCNLACEDFGLNIKTKIFLQAKLQVIKF